MTMTQMVDVDEALRRATDAGEIAGVVAIAATSGRSSTRTHSAGAPSTRPRR
jgi:hypothetical protein